jgi:hypothetical protein
MAREEALGQRRQERAALEEVRAALQKKEEEASRLNGELVKLSIAHEDQRQSLEEQGARSSSWSRRLRRHAGPSRCRRNRLKVSLFQFGFCSSIRSFGIRS